MFYPGPDSRSSVTKLHSFVPSSLEQTEQQQTRTSWTAGKGALQSPQRVPCCPHAPRQSCPSRALGLCTKPTLLAFFGLERAGLLSQDRTSVVGPAVISAPWMAGGGGSHLTQAGSGGSGHSREGGGGPRHLVLSSPPRLLAAPGRGARSCRGWSGPRCPCRCSCCCCCCWPACCPRPKRTIAALRPTTSPGPSTPC